MHPLFPNRALDVTKDNFFHPGQSFAITSSFVCLRVRQTAAGWQCTNATTNQKETYRPVNYSDPYVPHREVSQVQTTNKPNNTNSGTISVREEMVDLRHLPKMLALPTTQIVRYHP